ncbi:unnamed protein product [Rhizophagus irregularis]|nr:unnamed protein product [Rhizophagus irregularis]
MGFKRKTIKKIWKAKVILKKLENVESANRSWFEEGKSHLSISGKCGQVVQCYAFHSKTYNYNIPYNIDDFINKNNDNASKSINIIEDDNKELSEVTENMQINYSNSNNVQNDYKKEIIQQVKKHNIDYIDDENEIYNNPNLHSEEQDELEIPDDGF